MTIGSDKENSDRAHLEYAHTDGVQEPTKPNRRGPKSRRSHKSAVANNAQVLAELKQLREQMAAASKVTTITEAKVPLSPSAIAVARQTVTEAPKVKWFGLFTKKEPNATDIISEPKKDHGAKKPWFRFSKRKPDDKKTPSELKAKVPGRQWWLVTIGGCLVISGLGMAGLYTQNRNNMFFAVGFILLWGAAAAAIYKGLQKSDVGGAVITGHKKATGPVNSLNIYGKKNESGAIVPDRVAFEWVGNMPDGKPNPDPLLVRSPQGQPQQCLNDGHWYYVHIYNLEKAMLQPFILPDTQYVDPHKFAIVLGLPAHRRLFAKRASLLQKIGPVIMVVAFLIALVFLVATTPVPKV